MDDFREYRRSQKAQLRPYVPGELLAGVSISPADRGAGSPKAGDMIARNPANHDDQWLVAADYFAANFESAELQQGLPVPGYRPQNKLALDLVTAMKTREELILRELDHRKDDPAIDQRWLAIGRTQLEQAFMAINRAVFRPARITFENEAGEG